MNKKILLFTTLFSIFLICANATPFNQNLTDEENAFIESGEVLIKNINYSKNISLKKDASLLSEKLINEINNFSTKYLAEVIQIKPYEGNEDLPQKLEEILNNVPEYAGIPYFSERGQQWYNLYDSAEIVNTSEKDGISIIQADLQMEPFGTVSEYIEISKLYSTSESRRFVNGMLDRLSTVMKEEGKIVKTGLGLLDK